MAPRSDFTTKRLFVRERLAPGTEVELDRAQANYLLNVLRLKADAPVLLFDGASGEWRARLDVQGRKKAQLIVEHQTRPQTPASELRLLFAPLKQARLDYMVEKAVEMGAGHIMPVLTQYTQNRSPSLEKMRAYAVEAAEQCGVLAIPAVTAPMPLVAALECLPDDYRLIFCDEGDGGADPLSRLADAATGPVAILIGPEGGFSPEERAMLAARANVTVLPLGPRILRADTAAVAALTLVQATLGDWR